MLAEWELKMKNFESTHVPIQNFPHKDALRVLREKV